MFYVANIKISEKGACSMGPGSLRRGQVVKECPDVFIVFFRGYMCVEDSLPKIPHRLFLALSTL